MSWHGFQSRITAGIVLLLVAQPVPASVVETDLLNLTAPTLADGLGTLRDLFLEDSRVTDREHVGAVLQSADGRFRFTHGIAPANQDRVSFRIRLAEDLALVGFWHTHGKQGQGRELFSPDDAALVRESGLPFYLIDPGGNLRVLRPIDLRQTRSRIAIAAGTVRAWAPSGSAHGVLLTDVT
jgi:hypothetical protein